MLTNKEKPNPFNIERKNQFQVPISFDPNGFFNLVFKYSLNFTLSNFKEKDASRSTSAPPKLFIGSLFIQVRIS